MLANFIPPYDATVVSKLRDSGCRLDWQDEHGRVRHGRLDGERGVGQTCNPWDLRARPGGSSGGSAAAVAARMAPLAIGTDTGGSIRQPAAFCGTVGLKPTYGRVSRYGLVAFASSLDQVGPLSRTAEDAALLLEAIAGHDPRDSTCADRAGPAVQRRTATADWRACGLGVVRDHFGEGLDPEIAAAVRRSDCASSSRSGRRCRISSCRTASTASPPTTSSPPAKHPAIWPATMACITATAPTKKRCCAELTAERQARRIDGRHRHGAGAHVPPDARRRLWTGSQATHHAGHLCSECRILRRLLPEGA